MSKVKSLAIIACVFLMSCQNGGDKAVSTDMVTNPETASGEAAAPISAIEFDSELFEFGTISQGEKVSHSFTFRNTGEADLIITSAKGSCGCTIPQWPKEPIAPGAEGKIDVVFNSSGKSGNQHKKVSIIANTQPATNTIALSGEVIAPAKEEEEVEATESEN